MTGRRIEYIEKIYIFTIVISAVSIGFFFFLWALQLNNTISLSDLINFSVTFIAGLLGIIFGFLLSSASDRDKDRQTATTFLKLIHHELIEIKEMTPNDPFLIHVLYTDIWDSMVSSGMLCLLKPLQVMILSSLYKQIKRVSLNAEWLRQNWEEYQNIPESDSQKKKWVGEKLDKLGLEHFNSLKNLNQRIDQMLKEDMWVKEKWTVK